jgi:carbon-monoxide dehydrogenase medium subunit
MHEERVRPFRLERPGTVPEVLGLLARHGPSAMLLAGGQSLLILLRQRLAAPDVLVSLRRVSSLDALDAKDGALRLGAMTTYASVAAAPEIRTRWPLLARAANEVGSRHIRALGTVGGSVCHADPAGDVPVALMALDATVVLAGPEGERRLPADDVATGLFRTRLAGDEILEAILVPAQPAGATTGYARFSLRDGELPLAQAAVRLDWSDGVVAGARIAVGGGGDRPMRLPQVEAALSGARAADAGLARTMADRVRSLVRPFSDVRGPSDWKADVVAAITGRAIAEALGGRAGATRGAADA